MKKILFSCLFCIVVYYSPAQDLLTQRKVERLYKSGVDLMGRSEFGAARESFEGFLKESPTQDIRRNDAEYYQALCALNLYHSDGEKLIDHFIKNHADDPHATTAYYDLGNFFYAEKNYTRATSYYSKVSFSSLGSDQQNIGRFRWGYSLFNQKKLKEALDQFNAIKTRGGQYGPASSYYAGFIEYSNGDFAGALTDLRRAEQNSSYAKVVPYMVANAYYKQKNYAELLTYITSLKDKDITNADEIALLGAEAYYKKGDYKNALIGYQQFFEKHENADRGVMARAGFSAFTTGQDKAALAYFKGAVSDKDSVGYYASYYLGILYLKGQQKPLALTAFDNARKLKGDAALVEESSHQVIKISFDLGQSEQGITESEKFIKTYPAGQHTTDIKELLGQAYTNASNYNKAIEYIESLPSRSPAIDKAYQKATFLKGVEMFNKEDYAQAVQYFDKSMAKSVDPALLAEASLWSGEAYSIGKKYAQAVPLYENVIKQASVVSPEVLSRARYGLGYAFYNQQDYERALYNFKEFVNRNTKANPNYADGLIRLADCYYIRNNNTEALATYKQAVQLNSADNDYALLQEGIVLGLQRNYAESGKVLDQFITAYPKSRYLEEALFQRAEFDFEQAKYEAAVAGFGKIIAANKPSRFLPYAYQRRAAALFNLKEYGRTANDYGTIVEKFPTHPITKEVLLPLQEALNLAGRSGDFDRYFSSYKTSNPDAKGTEAIEFEAAKNLYFNQDYQKAITRFGNYISTYPDNASVTEAKYYRAESFYRLKDYDQALGIYNELASDNNFTYAVTVTGRVAELEFRQAHYEKAIMLFQKLARTSTKKNDQFKAWSGLMDAYYLSAKYDSADAYARLILEKGKVNPGAENKASLYLGKSAMMRGDLEGAKDEFLTTLNSARDEYGAEAKYLLGEIFFQTKEYKQCYETLVSLNNDFAAYPEWVGKSFLLLADNFAAQGDNFNARATLKSLSDKFPLATIKEQAKAKLSRLDEAEAKKKAEQKADTTDN